MCFVHILLISAQESNELYKLSVQKQKKAVKDKFFQVAKKDIVVYKKVVKRNDGKFRSLVKQFIYEKGKHYYQTGSRPFSINTSVYYNTIRIRIDKGLHSYIRKPIVYKSSGMTAIKCIIPKGSRYVMDNRVAVSDNLIIC